MSRANADWHVGMNLSQLYTLRNKAVASYAKKNNISCEISAEDKFNIGRVKTPTLNFIYLRDKEIASFIPKEFYEIESNYVPGFSGKRFVKSISETRISEKSAAQEVFDRIRDKKQGTVENVMAKVNTQNAPF